jgi:hypothetical protein
MADDFASKLERHDVLSRLQLLTTPQSLPSEARRDERLCCVNGTDLYVLGGGGGGVSAPRGISLHCLRLENVAADTGGSPATTTSTTSNLAHTAQVVELRPSPPLDTAVVGGASLRLVANEPGTLLAVWSEGGVSVVRLLRPGVETALAHRDNVAAVVCPAVSVGSFYTGVAAVVHVAWHPLSPRHLVVLTSDARLRLYDVAAAPSHAEQSYDVRMKVGVAKRMLKCDIILSSIIRARLIERHSHAATNIAHSNDDVVGFSFGSLYYKKNTNNKHALRIPVNNTHQRQQKPMLPSTQQFRVAMRPSASRSAPRTLGTHSPST